MNTQPEVEFRPLTAPASMDEPAADDFREFTRVRNAIYREIAGNDDDAYTPEELLPHYQPSDEEIRHAWTVIRDGHVIGRVGVDIPLEEGSKTAFWLVELLEAHWGLGIGSAGYALVEETAREYGRTVLQSWAQHPDQPGPRLEPPTGFGSIPEDHMARFYLRHGYALEQIERESVLDLPASEATVARLLADAEAASAGYRVVQWQLPTPAEYAEGFAWMKSRMSTDTPMGALEFDEETWDAERVALHDKRVLDGGRTMLVTAAQHIDSGELVAFNELVIGGDARAASHQEDTLVLREHRGHRLGMLVKCAGLTTWRREIAPDSPRVITYNAEENRPMLDINEAIGFTPKAYNGAWKKVLT
ncbi:MAG: histone acetyltransferase [Microbacterium sp. SCN 70-27]|uniref:GNAT family N-acetyltransferase n=1 Tax=unclassified Microbacterium TaxID=2609290 RepID=UPI00086BA898|nr:MULTISPECIES: GNAT family N-acetyltransferase [unclassified Microbacterium]MBN9223490.1 GNAT family N-acetyltransferase [Microbacterium sp.]ODT28639.1 MAG: histone acetyltransferase [Microbacterium sp. SCN 70-27]